MVCFVKKCIQRIEGSNKQDREKSNTPETLRKTEQGVKSKCTKDGHHLLVVGYCESAKLTAI